MVHRRPKLFCHLRNTTKNKPVLAEEVMPVAEAGTGVGRLQFCSYKLKAERQRKKKTQWKKAKNMGLSNMGLTRKYKYIKLSLGLELEFS